MLVSVVVVNWNARAQLLDCLASLERYPPTADWEAVVIDNGSEDGSVDAARRAAPWARIIANGSNRGLPAANNQGIAATTGKYILVSNADVVFRPGALTALCEAMQRHPRAAIVVPQLVQTNGARQTSAGCLPTLRDALLGEGASHRKDSMRGYWWHHWSHSEERPVGHGADAVYLVRRTAISEVGAQDEGFPLDWEAVEWSARMIDGGWEIWFTPTSVIEHVGGVSIRNAKSRWIISSHIGMYRYFRLRRHWLPAPLLAGVVASRALLKLLSDALGAGWYDRAGRRARLDKARDRKAA